MIRKRCAIYTRKSTEEGLDQAFNSLDAQRDACTAYIASQRHEGWTLVKNDYDDGGYSGGNVDRPGLQKLLDDIKSGLVDIVVVYKIDRLTRSLADFAKMVELFDAKGASFVSVTQQFNTTTSMGRLTLNVLLSFAQFEREVTAERIRDKIAASKKKGLWMGGSPPLGYDVKDRALVVNVAEAKDVRRIFEAYLELGSTRALFAWAKDNGIRTKLRHQADGSVRCGGKVFSRGNLHALLSYQTYIGEVRHEGKAYPGAHQPLMSRDLWERVHEKLSKTKETKQRDAFPLRPLAGLIFDETGDKLVSTYAVKSKRRYSYYISGRLKDGRDPSGWRLSAAMFETLVAKAIMDHLKKPRQVLGLLEALVEQNNQDATKTQRILSDVETFVRKVEGLPVTSQLQHLRPFISRIDLSPGKLTFDISPNGFAKEVGIESETVRDQDMFAGQHVVSAPSANDPQSQMETACSIEVPVVLKRRGVESHLILAATSEPDGEIDNLLLRTVAKAHAWFEELKNDRQASVKIIAARESLPASEVSRRLPLAFLSPKIVSSILRGKQPIELTTKRLTRLGELPIDWNEQAEVLGFPNL